MAQATADAVDMLERELLDLYRELNKKIPEALRENQYDLEKVVKLCTQIPFIIALGAADGGFVFRISKPSYIGYMGWEFIVYFTRYAIGLEIARDGFKAEIGVDLARRAISYIGIGNTDRLITARLSTWHDPYRPKIHVTKDPRLAGEALEWLRRNRGEIISIIEDILKTPVDIEDIEEKIENKVLDRLVGFRHHRDIRDMAKWLYVLALLPSIKKI